MNDFSKHLSFKNTEKINNTCQESIEILNSIQSTDCELIK